MNVGLASEGLWRPAPPGGSRPHGFYGRTADGVLACRLCAGLRGLHESSCAVVTVRVQLQEMTGQLGLYVSQMRELVETVDRLLHAEE